MILRRFTYFTNAHRFVGSKIFIAVAIAHFLMFRCVIIVVIKLRMTFKWPTMMKMPAFDVYSAKVIDILHEVMKTVSSVFFWQKICKQIGGIRVFIIVKCIGI